MSPFSVAQCRRHVTSMTNGTTATQIDYSEDGLAVTRIETISNGTIDFQRLGYVDATEGIERYRLEPGDILFSHINSMSVIGNCALYTGKEELHVGMNLLRLRPSKLVSPKFLFYCFRSGYVRHQVQTYAKPAINQASLSTANLKRILLPLPDLDTQKTIADFIDRETARIDLLIEKKERLSKLLFIREKSQVADLVARGLDPSFASKVRGPSWRGVVPDHWTESRIKSHFRIQKRQNYPDLTVLSVYREYGVIVKASRDDNINKTPLDVSSYQLVEPGDLVINKMKCWQGSLGVSTHHGITSPDYVVMTPIGSHDGLYLNHLLRAQPMPQVYQTYSNGIRPDQWRLEPDKFLSLPLFLPPRAEQETIAEAVEASVVSNRHLVQRNNVSVKRLREFRSALITSAVTGQIDVTTWGKQGSTDRRLDQIEEEMGA